MPLSVSLAYILNDEIRANTQGCGALTLTPESLTDGVSSQSLEGKKWWREGMQKDKKNLTFHWEVMF